MDLPYKVCPECGVEHVHAALVCSDCNVALVLPAAVPAAPPPGPPLPPASELAAVATGGPWEMQQLALVLQEAGLSSRIDAAPPAAPASTPVLRVAPRSSSGSATRFALYVRPDEAETAWSLIRELLPHEGSGEGLPREGATLEACPACGAAISPVAAACPDCGLEFAPVEEE